MERARSTGTNSAFRECDLIVQVATRQNYVIDHLRAVEGTAVAALIRERVSSENGASPPRKVSLRASDDRVDVSAIARAQGGGGHRQAAGFSTSMQWDELVAFLREAVAEQLAAAPSK